MNSDGNDADGCKSAVRFWLCQFRTVFDRQTVEGDTRSVQNVGFDDPSRFCSHGKRDGSLARGYRATCRGKAPGKSFTVRQ
jgi:hypothetical protein